MGRGEEDGGSREWRVHHSEPRHGIGFLPEYGSSTGVLPYVYTEMQRGYYQGPCSTHGHARRRWPVQKFQEMWRVPTTHGLTGGDKATI